MADSIHNDTLSELARDLERRLELLDGLATCSVEEYLRDPSRQLQVERLLQTAVQDAIDIAFRQASLGGQERPSEYRAAMDVLARSGALTPDAAHRMKELVGLRNVLVHAYRKVDHGKIHSHLVHSRETLREFVRAVLPPPSVKEPPCASS